MEVASEEASSGRRGRFEDGHLQVCGSLYGWKRRRSIIARADAIEAPLSQGLDCHFRTKEDKGQ